VRAQRTKRNVLAGMPLDPAMLKAGYAASTARHQPPTVVAAIKRDLAGALERKGLTDEQFAEEIIEAMRSTDPGLNWGARVQVMKLAASVRGDEAPKKHDVNLHGDPEQVRRGQNRLVDALEWLE